MKKRIAIEIERVIARIVKALNANQGEVSWGRLTLSRVGSNAFARRYWVAETFVCHKDKICVKQSKPMR